jgi:D-alanyl-D-alanine carboxypeptidase-like protein
MKRHRDFFAAGIHRHYFTAPGYYRHFITSGILISLLGAVMLVFLAAFRDLPDEAKAASGEAGASGPAGMLVLEVSTKAELLPELAASLKEIPEIETVTEVRSGIRWLSAWNAEGGPESRPTAGYLIPTDVGAVNPEEYQEILPESVRGTLLDLGVGTILSRTAANLRGIKDKGNLQFGPISIPVMAVVDDALTQNHEMIITNQNADGFGISNNRYLVVAVSSADDGAEVTAEIQKRVPPDVPVKVRTPFNSGYGDGPGLLSMGEIKSFFGEFPARPLPLGDVSIPQSWIDDNTALETVPLLGEFRCNKALFPQIRGAIAEIEKQGLSSLINSGDFGGCFSPRFIRAGVGGGLSRHAWGAAIDFNVSSNLMGEVPEIDQRLVNIMGDWGFSWGGNWTVPDGMHFEFVRKVG